MCSALYSAYEKLSFYISDNIENGYILFKHIAVPIFISSLH